MAPVERIVREIAALDPVEREELAFALAEQVRPFLSDRFA
jgi:hypothetical protein